MEDLHLPPRHDTLFKRQLAYAGIKKGCYCNLNGAVMMMDEFLFPRLPDFAEVICEDGNRQFSKPEAVQAEQGVELSFRDGGEGMQTVVAARNTGIRFIRLRWNIELPPESVVCGDAWERTYGELNWHHPDPAVLMPWYFTAFHDGLFLGFGVRVRPAAFAGWQCDPRGITLWLDVRCGTAPLRLGNRELTAATLVGIGIRTERPAVCHVRRLCEKMCSDPLLPKFPAYGFNNWYYAYGKSSSAQLKKDAELLESLTGGLRNRPFMVIDDGWELNSTMGPWEKTGEGYGELDELAADIRSRGLRPGIWFRPLKTANPSEMLCSLRDPQYLDPSLPEVLELVRNDMSRFVEAGYELIKHDFSTFDVFGRWGFEMRGFPASGNWMFRKNDRSSAEIVIDFYRALLEGAGSALILGCNIIGHLGAGMVHIVRSGDDTSGLIWERTRKMGVNSLAFRLAQHRVFFDVDPDCVGVTEHVPWQFNRQWGRLVAESGTTLFASVKPGIPSEQELAEMRELMRVASEGGGRVEPLDWLENPTPARWEINGREECFDWFGAQGSVPEFVIPGQ